MLESNELIHIDELVSEKLMLNEERVLLNFHSKINGTKDAIWYYDIEASNHMTGNHMALTNLDETVKGKVQFGDGFVIKIEGCGTAIFKCQNGQAFNLKNDYYIPQLKSNIISLGQLDESGVRVEVKE